MVGAGVHGGRHVTTKFPDKTTATDKQNNHLLYSGSICWRTRTTYSVVFLWPISKQIRGVPDAHRSSRSWAGQDSQGPCTACGSKLFYYGRIAFESARRNKTQTRRMGTSGHGRLLFGGVNQIAGMCIAWKGGIEGVDTSGNQATTSSYRMHACSPRRLMFSFNTGKPEHDGPV